MSLRIAARAPSNIAIIKYMGKSDAAANLPDNPSISMTLDRLCTFAELRESENTRWLPEMPATSGTGSGSPAFPGASVPELSPKGIDRILAHVIRTREELPALLAEFGLRGVPRKGFELRTANTFPTASGIASSASSFAAVTLAAAAFYSDDPGAFRRRWDTDPRLRQKLSSVARRGSGSSCRSFEGPWVIWEGDKASELRTSLPRLAHFVILVSTGAKEVSSSDAHLAVKSSPLWTGRVERAKARVSLVSDAAARGELKAISALAWSEFWEMHSLFHTAAQPFTYWQPATLEALSWVRPFLREAVPPVVTMDAGPNIHVIVPEEQRDLWRERIESRFGRRGAGFLEDGQGTGAVLEVLA